MSFACGEVGRDVKIGTNDILGELAYGQVGFFPRTCDERIVTDFVPIWREGGRNGEKGGGIFVIKILSSQKTFRLTVQQSLYEHTPLQFRTCTFHHVPIP